MIDKGRSAAGGRFVTILVVGLHIALVWPSATMAAELTTLHSFGLPPDGSVTQSSLVRDENGVLYGTTRHGGSGGYGTVFSLAPPEPGKKRWKKRLLHNFTNGPDGGIPVADLTGG